MNSFSYSNDNKRYHSIAYENARRGKKRCKAVLEAGPGCPNFDGLPGETSDMMVVFAKTLGKLRPDGVKFH